MDVSPKTLREVEFREKMRGYHPEDVDQFLERVAAGIEVLQDRLRQAIERAQRAEQAATEAGGNDDALRRTLLLAQRTADMAVQEAREQAARIVTAAEQQAQAMVADAEQRTQGLVGETEQRAHSLATESERRAQALLADAERRAQSMIADAEQRARRGHEDTLMEVRADLATLEVTRARLQEDVDAMTRWVAEHRNQLRAALEDALTRVDQIDLSPPSAAGTSYPAEGRTAPTLGGAPHGVSASVTSPSGAADLAASWAPPAPAMATPAVTSWAPSAAATGAAPWAPTATPGPAAPGGTAAPGPSGSGTVGTSPTNRPREEAISWQPPEPEVAADDSGDADPYFAELRRAISDQDPLGPRSDGDPQGAAGGHAAPGSDA